LSGVEDDIRERLEEDHDRRDDDAPRGRNALLRNVLAVLDGIHADVAQSSAHARPARKVSVVRLIEPMLRLVCHDQRANGCVQEKDEAQERFDGDRRVQQGDLGHEDLRQQVGLVLERYQTNGAQDDFHNGPDEGVSIVPADAVLHATGDGARVHWVISEEQRCNQDHRRGDQQEAGGCGVQHG